MSLLRASVTGTPRLRLFLSAIVVVLSITFITRLDSSNIPTPSQPTDACKLHYSHFHLLFTIPPLAILYFLTAPFLTSLDWHKLYILPVIAFVWTTPWDNELVRQEAWWYPTSCVLARIGYVPVEEYAFFVLQSLVTTLFTILFTRWSTPRSSNNHASAVLLPLLPALAIVSGLYTLLYHVKGQKDWYYLSMIMWWSSVPLTLLWWGTAQSWFGLYRNAQAKVWLWCVIVPTLYLCSADVYALRRGTWHISEKKSLRLFVVPDLPIEEAFFFLATNLILVSACFAFDRVVWQRRAEDVAQSNKDSFAPLSPTYFTLDWNTVKRVWHTFTRLDIQREEVLQGKRLERQREHALRILARASKSFNIAATLLPWDLRVDLGCLYAFARAMDDFIDQPHLPSSSSSNEQQVDFEKAAEQRISLLLNLVKIAFNAKAKSNEVIEEKLSQALTNYARQAEDISEQHRHDLLLSALAASSLREIVPERLWKELIDGYTVDSAYDGPHFTTFEQQATYAQNVAGSIGEMCVRVVLARQGILVAKEYKVPRDIGRDTLVAASTMQKEEDSPLAEIPVIITKQAPKVKQNVLERLLRDSRRMGVSLQLVNIARDVVKDAVELDRCYLVTGREDLADIRKTLCSDQMRSMVTKSGRFESEEEDEVANLLAPLPSITLEAIYSQKLYLLEVADEIYQSTIQAIDLLPCKSAQTGLRVACAVYSEIGKVIRRDGPTKCLQRSKASGLSRLWTVFKTVYWRGV